MQKMHTHFSTTKTPQTQPLAASDQVKMRSGGFGWEVNDWTKLDRFLILGSEGGTYYTSERKLTRQAAKAVLRCVKADGPKTVARIVEISAAGRAPKNDPAIFALAMAAKLGDEPTRAAAYQALPRVCRIGTHLFHFAEYAKAFGGLGGNGFKRALRRWYLGREASKLAYQAVKYQQRDGWSHRDLLRLAHPKAAGAEHGAIFEWIVKGWQGGAGEAGEVPEALRIIWAFEQAKVTTEVGEMVKLITDHRLPHECVPNALKKHPEVWEALLQHMPLGAMVRNLNKMTALGLLTNTSAATAKVLADLSSLEALKRARMHPMSLLVALKTYQRGQGLRGKLSWSPAGKIVDALDRAFYLAFGAVRPTGKRLCLALDVSGSMTCGVSGVPVLSCREAAAAMALVSANVEASYEMVAFTCGRGGVSRNLFGKRGQKGKGMKFNSGTFGWGFGITPIDISPRQRLDDVVRLTENMPFGGTDCALPMRWALATKTPVDAFVIYTDNESWAGEVHVDQALNDYRQKLGIPAKLVAVALSADRFSVANPNDAGQLDVVGFDTVAPTVISDFVFGGDPLDTGRGPYRTPAG
jgi:60 kDa SS-A/Ro ribonucleoprotein